MTTNPTAIAAIINMLVIEMRITDEERLGLTSIPVKPVMLSVPWMAVEPRNDNPGIDAVKMVFVSTCPRFVKADVETGKDDVSTGTPAEFASSLDFVWG